MRGIGPYKNTLVAWTPTYDIDASVRGRLASTEGLLQAASRLKCLQSHLASSQARRAALLPRAADHPRRHLPGEAPPQGRLPGAHLHSAVSWGMQRQKLWEGVSVHVSVCLWRKDDASTPHATGAVRFPPARCETLPRLGSGAHRMVARPGRCPSHPAFASTPLAACSNEAIRPDGSGYLSWTFQVGALGWVLVLLGWGNAAGAAGKGRPQVLFPCAHVEHIHHSAAVGTAPDGAALLRVLPRCLPAGGPLL